MSDETSTVTTTGRYVPGDENIETDHDYYVFWASALSAYMLFGVAVGVFYRKMRDKYEDQPLVTRASSTATRSSSAEPPSWSEAQTPLRRDTRATVSTLAQQDRPRFSSADTEYHQNDQYDRGEDVDELHAAAERRWDERSHKDKIRKCALNMQLVGIGLVVYRTLRNLLADFCIGFDKGVFTWPPPRVESIEYISMAVLIWQADRCRKLKDTVRYWALLCAFNLYVPASILWPFQWSCRELEAPICQEAAKQWPERWYIKEAVDYADCSLHGPTATLMMMTWILIQPWALLRREMVHLVWVWLFGVYVVWSFLARYIVGIKLFTNRDVMGRVLVLSAAIVASTFRKQGQEELEKTHFICDMKTRKASEKIFNVFEYMVPEHVVLRMLRGDSIADPVEKATIMFVMLSEFDRRAEQATPTELLSFLNEVFTYMDQACEDNKVTKVETVGEEYVACVGVIPEDIKEAVSHGHGRILGKMFRAGEKILQLHWEKDSKKGPTHPVHKKWGEVKLKIGLHTGPIVAGVIGRKLPRYRLFGDTINTAARMMQKSQVGSLQFGDATNDELPSFVESHLRGEVEMKGKGMVRCYIFDRLRPTGLHAVDGLQADRPAREDEEPEGQPMRTRRGSITETILEDGDDRAGGCSPVAESMRGGGGSTQQDPSPGGPRREDSSRWRRLIGGRGAASPSSSSRSKRKRRKEGDLELVTMDVYDIRHKNPEMFDEVLKNLRPDRGSGRGIPASSLRMHFRPDVEKDWVVWSHKHVFVDQFFQRISRQLWAFAGLTIFDFLIMVIFVWPRQHWINLELEESLPRLAIFFLSRGVCIGSVAWWRSRWLSRRAWFMSDPWKIQNGMFLTTVIQLLFLFISYDALTAYDTADGMQRWIDDRQNAGKTDVHAKAQPDQIFAFCFTLSFIVTSQWHPFSFWTSIVYWLMAIGLCSMLSWCREATHGTMYLSFSGKVLFTINCAMNSRFAWDQEKGARKRFWIQRACERTQADIHKILDQLMPKLVVEDLARPNCTASMCSLTHKQACIAQSDLCGFTQLSATRTPPEVVDFISDLFGLFDDLCDKYGIYKVETIGDAYIAGQADRMTEENNPLDVLLFGLEKVDIVHKWSERLAGDHEPVSCRVGIQYGECIGGIVGTDMQRYHLFGDLMSQLEVLEACGKPGMVQLSPASKKAVDESMRATARTPDLVFTQREDDLRTSKGEVHSFDEVGGRTWLVSRSAPGHG